MQSWNAIGLFCDDIREENRTLLGIFTDHLALGRLPGALPKMGIYVRVHVAADAPPQRISVHLVSPDNSTELGGFDLDFVKRTQEDSRRNEMPLAGFIVTAIAAPMIFSQAGQIHLVARFGDEETICGN